MGCALLLFCVCMLPLIAVAVLPDWVETFSLFAARCSMMASFTILYIYAPEVHPYYTPTIPLLYPYYTPTKHPYCTPNCNPTTSLICR